jgi:hypothetical protein
VVAGGDGGVILRKKNIAMGEFGGSIQDICGGQQLQAWCGGSSIMFHGTSLANWRSTQREGFRTTVGVLERGVTTSQPKFSWPAIFQLDSQKDTLWGACSAKEMI